MIAVRHFIGLFRDSPTYGQDRANLVSGFTIGITGLLLNSAILMLLLPLMVAPNDRTFASITQNIEFGQLMALILLGGASGFATILVPLRMVSVFLGPRTGRYFDQIVLSGITPLRYVIGKATSQNLFLALILFLLLPWLVLSLTLGGVDLMSCLAGLFLLWLYCMALALVTLWATMYFNDVFAAVLVIAVAALMYFLGFIPMSFQVFLLTPVPVLMQPVYESVGYWVPAESPGYFALWGASVISLSAVSCIALTGIFWGPLYGIIRENSTFGEVVRKGDSGRKRRLRLRPHIQRSSEIAFFYENRSGRFQRHEGLFRWGAAFLLVLGLMLTGSWLIIQTSMTSVRQGGWSAVPWLNDLFHAANLTLHGCSLALAAFLFSHSRNSIFLKQPLMFGRSMEVRRLDTLCFLACLLIGTSVSIGTPFLFEHLYAGPADRSVFASIQLGARTRTTDFVQVAIEGTAVISVAAVVLYSIQRLVCLTTWVKSGTFFVVAVLYCFGVCIMPLFFAEMAREFPELRDHPAVIFAAPRLAMVSPVVAMAQLYGEMGPGYPKDLSRIYFYAPHALLFLLVLAGARRNGRLARQEYLPGFTESGGQS